MQYQFEPTPFMIESRLMTPAKLRKAFQLLLDEMPSRIKKVSDYIFDARGVRITPQSTPDVINQLPALIASLGSLRQIPDEEFEFLIARKEAWKTDILRDIMPRMDLSAETRELAFDASLLWGEAFRVSYPEAKWAVGGKPKSSVDYAAPVLVGPKSHWMEFGVVRELVMHVSGSLQNEVDRFTLTEVMLVRARDLKLLCGR